jgi:hypothetical protein
MSHLGGDADGVVQVAPNVEQQRVHIHHPTGLARHDAQCREVHAAAAAFGVE